MKKIAFCISGLFKPSSTFSEAYSQKFNYIKEKIRDYQADVFIFSFSKELEEEIVNLFEPKKYKFEIQKSFKEEINSIDQTLDKETAKRVFSFFYSKKQVCLLKKQYEKEHNFTYDVVVWARPDLGYIHTQNFELPDLNKIDPSFLYSIFWNQLNAGLADWYFVSNSKNIDFISLIYDNLQIYLQNDSTYERCITNGLPYSNCDNRFSQEIFKQNPEHTEKFLKFDLLNNHILIKYYLLQNNKFSLNFLNFYK